MAEDLTCQFCQRYVSNNKRNFARHLVSCKKRQRRNQNAPVYSCKIEHCNYVTRIKQNFQRHKASHLNSKALQIYKCPKPSCQFFTKRKGNLKKHIDRHSNENVLPRKSCSVCKLAFSSEQEFLNHLESSHSKQHDFSIISQAYGSKLRVYSRNLRIRPATPSCIKTLQSEFSNLCKRIIVKDFKQFQVSSTYFLSNQNNI